MELPLHLCSQVQVPNRTPQGGGWLRAIVPDRGLILLDVVDDVTKLGPVVVLATSSSPIVERHERIAERRLILRQPLAILLHSELLR